MNSSLSAKKASSSSRNRSKLRIIRFSFNTFIVLIFSTCIVFYAILSVHIHSKLKLQQHDQKEAVDNNNNNNEHVNVVNSINVNVNARRSSSIQNHHPLDNNNIHNSNNNNFRPRQKEEEKINNDNNNNNNTNDNGNRKYYGNDSKNNNSKQHDTYNNSNNSNNNNNNNNKNSNKGLSACLLVNDENPRLPEWIAYHYQMLPLRSLTITVDPASRSSPIEILNRWTNTNTQNHNKEMTMGLEVQIWEEKDFLPKEDSYGSIRHGACNASDVDTDCLWQHRKRQRYFIKKCMADFKQRNMTWVLLIDVDEYITFNRIREEEDDDDDDPKNNVPLDYAPEGVPTLSDWKKKEYKMVDSVTGELVTDVRVEGTITGLPENGLNGKRNGDQITTGSLVTQHMDHLLGIHGVAYGNVVEESSNNNNNSNNDGGGMKYYLRDDFAFRDAVPMAHAPGGVPTLKDSYMNGTSLHATIYDDATYYYTGKTKKKDGESIQIETNWRESPPDANMNTLSGGHLMLGTDGQTYYVERERGLWPPHLSSKESMDIRKRLPAVGDYGERTTTVMDVLEREAEIFGEYARETIGPCLSMPRLLFGSHEEEDDHDHDRSSSTNNIPNSTTTSWTSNNNNNNMAPEGFVDGDFVTLRYRWHAIKEASVNKFQKAIVDVSRLRMDSFGGEAENIHVPLKYYCRRDPPRFSTSFLRVNHYLDSFEAYSYRNDARSSKRQCRECYDEKGKEAAASMDDDIRPWIKSFFRQVGPQKAKQLLAGAGNFVRLS